MEWILNRKLKAFYLANSRFFTKFLGNHWTGNSGKFIWFAFNFNTKDFCEKNTEFFRLKYGQSLMHRKSTVSRFNKPTSKEKFPRAFFVDGKTKILEFKFHYQYHFPFAFHLQFSTNNTNFFDCLPTSSLIWVWFDLRRLRFLLELQNYSTQILWLKSICVCARKKAKWLQ